MKSSTRTARYVRVLAGALFGCLLGATAAYAANATVVLNKDVMAKEKFPDTNFGTDTQLQTSAQAGFQKIIFVQFTVSGIPTGSTGVTAQLKLRCTTGGTGRPISAHSVASTTWIESGTGSLTWTNKPALGASLSTVSTHTAGADSVWTVSGHVNGNGTFALGLDTTFAGDTTFSSREGANAPVLTVTYTPPGTSVKIIVTGDFGGNGASQVKSLVQTYYNDNNTVLAMGAGDNAYSCGSLSDFNTKFDPNWGGFLKRPAGGAQWFYPGTGHHDWGMSGVAGLTGCSVLTPADGYAVYMSNHTVQQFGNGQWYYSYDIPGQPWRIIELSGTINAGSNIITAKDQPMVPCGPGSAQYNWLQNKLSDAAANHLMVVAVWSDPHFATKDDHHVAEPTVKPFWDLLYQYRPNAAIVLNGHKHNYERFAKQDNNGNAVSNGIVEIVTGTGGNGHYIFSTPIAANSLVRNDTDWGVTELTLNASSVQVRFISSAAGFPQKDNITLTLAP